MEIAIGVTALIFLVILEYKSYYYFNYFLSKKGVSKVQIYAGLMWTIITFAFLSEFRFFTQDALANENNADKLIKRTGLWNLNQAIVIFKESTKELDICAESQNNLDISSVGYKSQNIVVIIGESYIKRHSSLYGYPLNTNPKLSERKNLVLFNDVISSANATTISFRNFLSLSNVDDSLRWCDAPLFPTFFKKVGYNVVFYSNQYVCEGKHNVFDAGAGFFNHPSIVNNLFSYRNHQLFAFDMQLVDDYAKKRKQLEKDSLNLIIFHLEGQHNPGVERYPSEYSYFTPDSINRPDLSFEKKKLIAEYDNAVRYNDLVVDRIISLFENRDAIIIYFADHGEEIYDFRDKAGRSYDFDAGGPLCLKYQVDVPMMVYMSSLYNTSHPILAERIKTSAELPFMTDDFPHLILELAGIETSWFNPERSLINEKYNSSRRRRPCNHYYE